MDKRRWITPQLVVIARSRPEEAVLLACKSVVLDGANKSGRCQVSGKKACSVLSNT